MASARSHLAVPISPSHLAAGLVSLPLALPKFPAHISHAGVPKVSWSCSQASSCSGAVARALGSWR